MRLAGRAFPLLIPALWVLGGGCARPESVRAVGPSDEVSVITNLEPGTPVRTELRRLFEYPIEVVGPEAAFRITFVAHGDFEGHRRVKNQVLAVDLSGKDALSRETLRVLAGHADAELAARRPFSRILRDRWALGQVSLFAVAWSENDLSRLLAETDSTFLRSEFENAVVEQLPQTMYALGEEDGLTERIAQTYGWSLRLVRGFHGAEDPGGQGVKFNAVDPVRLLLVHWKDGEIPLEPSAWDTVLAHVLWKYNEGDVMLPERTRVSRRAFQGQPSLRWEGVWQNEGYVIGGPFRAVACHRGGKSYLLVGMVYAPGQDKVAALRQVEAMLTTFREVR